MIFSNMKDYLNESTSGFEVEEVIATNEGFTHEGGFEQVLLLAESEMHAIKMTGMNCESYSLVKAIQESASGMLTESSMEEAYMLQEKVLGGLFESLRQMLKRLAGRVKEIINSLKMQFDKTFNKTAYLTNAKEALKGVSDFNDVSIEGYTYTQNAVDPISYYNKMAGKARSEYEKVVGKIKDGITKVEEAKKSNEEAIKAYEEYKSEDFIDTMIKETGADDRADYAKHLYKELRNGKDSKDEITVTSTSESFKMIDGFKTAQATISGLANKVDTLYSAAKKAIDDAEKKHNKVHGEAKDGAKVGTELKLKMIQSWADRTSKANVFANEAIKAKLAAIREEKAQNVTLINKAMSGSKKARKEARLGESTDIVSQFMPEYLR